ncbi:N2227-like protein-domain containing protein [Rhodotorula toruloides]|uniref:N2227-like protein-domain containing protein n=1 Tax=Rhodotorula toruloides TaxID=5286 RepID=A0A2T0AH79_RHOTO|nr:N2227-like protein-domain containing protein [Rhodotorula toruloides]
MAVDGHTQLQTPTQGPQSPLLAFVLTLALFSLVSLLVLSPPTRLFRRIHRLASRPVARLLGRIPVPSALQAPTDLAVAIRSFSHYSSAQQNALSRKWVAFERMPRRHRALGTRVGWEKTLERAEEAVETNALVTDELAALGLEQARRDGVPVGLRSHFYHANGRVVETLKHFVRDWSEVGKAERDALFPPILEALREEFGKNVEGKKVLVPGCGLARLAYEIACEGFSVEANDFSHFMNLGSSLLFTRTHTTNQHTLAPYIHLFSHQRTAANLLRTVSFPDVVPRKDVDLRFCPGDFLGLCKEEEGRHEAVVTLFFIDTASNMISYFETIYHTLKPGGIWINLGPLLYYGNPGMELPLEDVIRLAEMVGFEVERRKSLRDVRYTADELGMYQYARFLLLIRLSQGTDSARSRSFTYDCEFWVARKSATDAKEEARGQGEGKKEA